MPKKSLLFFGLVFFLLFSQYNFNSPLAEEYLNSVIDKINKMEKDLQKLQKESNNTSIADSMAHKILLNSADIFFFSFN